jgi:hypothetical protein
MAVHEIGRIMSVRCRHAFEFVCVHANGDVVCSIIDGRGDFVIGNVQPLAPHPDGLRYLAPHLKPFTALPGESRQNGW